MAVSTRGTLRFLLFISIGLLVLATLQGKVMDNKFAYMNEYPNFGKMVSSWTEQMDRR